jgi:hypothetical protein
MIRKLQSGEYRLYSSIFGFTGTCDEAGAELEAIALAGKRSLRLAATLKLMRPA